LSFFIETVFTIYQAAAEGKSLLTVISLWLIKTTDRRSLGAALSTSASGHRIHLRGVPLRADKFCTALFYDFMQRRLVDF